MKKSFIHECVFVMVVKVITHNLNVILSLKRGTFSGRNITLSIDYCVNYYCGLLFNYKKKV